MEDSLVVVKNDGAEDIFDAGPSTRDHVKLKDPPTNPNNNRNPREESHLQ